MLKVKIVGLEAIRDAQSSTFVPNVFDRAGLWLLVKSFNYFGFKILESPESHCCLNRPYVAFLLTVTITAFVLNCYVLFPLIINNDRSLDKESAGFYLVTGLAYLTVISIYCFGILNARKYSTLFRSLASAVDQANDSEHRQKFVRSTKRTFFLSSVSYSSILTVIVILRFQQGEHWLDDQGKIPRTSPLVLIFSQVLNFTGFVTAGLFYFFTSIYLSIACKMIDFLLEVYLSPELSPRDPAVDDIWNDPQQMNELRADEMRQKLINHQKLSQIVEQANSVFTHYLLFTLTVETTMCIAFAKLLTMKHGEYSIVAYTYAFNIATMLRKICMCGNINEKLKKSLILNKLQNFYLYSNEQVNYVLYLEEQNISRAEITYGNLFPVRKTFIFTIIGTVLTYAIVLQGL